MSCLIQATWSGCVLLRERLSMVATLRPETADKGVWQERTAWLSRCTVQAPHRAAPQPNLVPVNPSSSRITQRRGVSGSASAETCLPFKLKLTLIACLLLAVQETIPMEPKVHRVNPRGSHFVADCDSRGNARIRGMSSS